MKKLTYVAALLLISCGNISQPQSKEKSVFGQDTRVALQTDSPFNAIGYLTSPTGAGCTAFMIGPRVAMTVAHCTTGTGKMTIAFQGSDTPMSVSLLERGTDTYTGKINDEYAFLLLDGRWNQWLGTSDNSKPGDALNLAGYSADYDAPTTTDKCSARIIENNILYHDCAMQTGASGAPIFELQDGDKWRTVGIQVAQVSKPGEAYTVWPTWSKEVSNVGLKITISLMTKIHKYLNDYN